MFDYIAVQYSSEASLKELGLKLGDVFELKALVEKTTLQDEKLKDDKEERKRKLHEISQKRKLIALNPSALALKIALARLLQDLKHEEFN